MKNSGNNFQDVKIRAESKIKYDNLKDERSQLFEKLEKERMIKEQNNPFGQTTKKAFNYRKLILFGISLLIIIIIIVIIIVLYAKLMNIILT